MIFLLRLFVFANSLLLIATAHARVFSFSESTNAAYMFFNYGPSTVGDAAFKNEAATGIKYNDGIQANLSGEFGYVFSTSRTTVRLGMEILRPLRLEDVEAKSAAGTLLYRANSDVLGMIPKVGIELTMFAKNSFRILLMLEGGAGTLTVKNSYKMTAAGTAAFPGVVDHNVEYKGATSSFGSSLGFEQILSDTTSYVFQLGYRALYFPTLTYGQDTNTFQGAKSAGAPVVETSGAGRLMDFTNYFASLGLRIYL